jgi:2'-5' RNA ligase
VTTTNERDAKSEQVKPHWWWRPGFRVGRRFYTCYVTFEGQDDLHRLVDDYQRTLTTVPYLDLIPRPWRHMTVQGVGFTDEVSNSDINHIAAAAQRHLSQVPAATLTFTQPAISHTTEAITLSPEQGHGMHAIRDAIRAGIADVWGDDQVPESDTQYRPHTSAAYANAAGPAQPIRDAIETVTSPPAQATITNVNLIEMHRDNRMYQWTVHTQLSLGK